MAFLDDHSLFAETPGKSEDSGLKDKAEVDEKRVLGKKRDDIFASWKKRGDNYRAVVAIDFGTTGTGMVIALTGTRRGS